MQLSVQVTQSLPGLEVRLDAGEAKGKGVFATKASLKGYSFPCLQLWACKCSYTSDYAFRDALRPIWVVALQDFTAGSVLISEPPLVGIQHNANRTAALVCSHCFRYLGSVETQIGVRLAALHGEGELHACAQYQVLTAHSLRPMVVRI